MAHPLFFFCPNCRKADTLDRQNCKSCNADITVQGTDLLCNGNVYSSGDYYDLLQEHLAFSTNSEKQDEQFNYGMLLHKSNSGKLRQGNKQVPVNGYHRFFREGLREFQVLGEGELLVYEDGLVFTTSTNSFHWAAADILSITTNGHRFEFKVKHQPVYQIQFQQESPLKYEILLRKWIDQYYQRHQLGAIIEYQPHIRTVLSRPSRELWQIALPKSHEKQYFVENIIMGSVKNILRQLCRLWISVDIRGKSNWHKDRSGIVIVNHQSAMDPFVVAAYLDRRVAFITKDTSFSAGIVRKFLLWAMSIPTTRYQTNPGVVRIMKAFLQKGIKVGVFPEGERCWDGRLLPFKLSLVKILMASRQAIYPIVLDKVYDFWPRWANTPRSAKVTMDIVAPFCLLPDRSVDQQRDFLENIFKTTLNGRDPS